MSFIIETSQKYCCPDNRLYVYKKITTKIIAFLVNCLSLLIIPSTESFIIVMKGHYTKKWSFILAYIVVTLIIPILTTFLLVKTNYSEICDKYKTSKCCKRNNCYCYMEIVDIIKQIGYSIVATYDIPWACIGFEAVWFILIIILRIISKYKRLFTLFWKFTCYFFSKWWRNLYRLKRNRIFLF